MIESVVALALGNPAPLVALVAAAWWWSTRARSMAAAGMLGRFASLAKLGVVGVTLAATLVVLLAHRRTRHATVTVLMCLGACVFAFLMWAAPGLALQIALIGAAPAVAWAFVPYGPVARYLDGGAPLSVASWKAAAERSRQRRILAQAVGACAGDLAVVGSTAVVDGHAAIRVAVPAGANPHALDGAADSITNAVNVLAQQEGADLTAVAARVQHGADGLTVHVDTQPRRLPTRVEWPGGQQ
jgi:hypothetical protein